MSKMPKAELNALLKTGRHTFKELDDPRGVAWYVQNNYKDRMLYEHPRLQYLSIDFEFLLEPVSLFEELRLGWSYIKGPTQAIYIGRKINIVKPEPHHIRIKHDDGPITFRPSRGEKVDPIERELLLRWLNKVKRLYYQERDRMRELRS